VRSSLDDERRARTPFLDQILAGKDDRAFVIQFARSVELLQDVTPSRPKLQAALQQLDTRPPNRNAPTDNPDSSDRTNQSSRPDGRRGGNWPRRGAFGGGTTLYDAVFLACDEVMSKQKGRKALVVLPDGVDRGSNDRQ